MRSRTTRAGVADKEGRRKGMVGKVARREVAMSSRRAERSRCIAGTWV
jgi:hypothetical protein